VVDAEQTKQIPGATYTAICKVAARLSTLRVLGGLPRNIDHSSSVVDRRLYNSARAADNISTKGQVRAYSFAGGSAP